MAFWGSNLGWRESTVCAVRGSHFDEVRSLTGVTGTTSLHFSDLSSYLTVNTFILHHENEQLSFV